ncbi:hypothetical protein [Streptomyces sp. NPDC059631]|uniref:hypothetical protein n=1 Tax=unclassified Streptomyces TaxID=2593676 RepID=UPI0036B68F8C
MGAHSKPGALTRRALRTVLQTVVGVAAAVPLLAAAVAQSGLTEAWPWLAGAVSTAAAVAGALARFMAMPAVEQLLDRVGLGLVGDDGGTGP